MSYALCPMPYALCPMPYAQSYLIFLTKAITKSFFLHFPFSDLMNSKSIQNGWGSRISLKVLIVVILITGRFFRFTRPGSQSLLFRRISHLAANLWLHRDGNNAARFSKIGRASCRE